MRTILQSVREYRRQNLQKPGTSILIWSEKRTENLTSQTAQIPIQSLREETPGAKAYRQSEL